MWLSVPTTTALSIFRYGSCVSLRPCLQKSCLSTQGRRPSSIQDGDHRTLICSGFLGLTISSVSVIVGRDPLSNDAYTPLFLGIPVFPDPLLRGVFVDLSLYSPIRLCVSCGGGVLLYGLFRLHSPPRRQPSMRPLAVSEGPGQPTACGVSA